MPNRPTSNFPPTRPILGWLLALALACVGVGLALPVRATRAALAMQGRPAPSSNRA